MGIWALKADRTLAVLDAMWVVFKKSKRVSC